MTIIDERLEAARAALYKAGLTRKGDRIQAKQDWILEVMDLAKFAKVEAPHMAEELQAALDALGLLLAIIK